MDDFEARRKINQIKTKVGQEARANPPAASPVPVPVYPHPVFAVACGFLNGIGVAVFQWVFLFALSRYLTAKSFSIYFTLSHYRFHPTPLAVIILSVVTISSCLWAGYVTARLSASWRFVLALGVGGGYTALLMLVGGPSWQFAIPPFVCLGGALFTRWPVTP